MNHPEYCGKKHIEPKGQRVPSTSASLNLSQRGFTLVELMIAVAILALLLGVALPSFQEALTVHRISSYANDLHASAALARSEAIKRNRTVQLCASSNGTSCTGSWGQGWIVNANGTIVSRHEGVSTGYSVSGGVTTIEFQGTGTGATSTTLTICRADPVGSSERVLTITATGRASISKTTTGSCS